MHLIKITAFILIAWLLQSCSASRKPTAVPNAAFDIRDLKSSVVIKKKVAAVSIDVKSLRADDLVSFAETLIGTPYRYGSAKKENGFDCSGFINYVFNNFNISVPRTSSTFTNAGKEVKPAESKRGDLILFTGSDASSGVVGHMGIVTHNEWGKFSFIHASSSKGVIVSTLSNYYIQRFVKVIRIFP